MSEKIEEAEEKKKPAIVRFFSAIGGWIKRHKGLVIFLGILIVLSFFTIKIVKGVKEAKSAFVGMAQSNLTTEVKLMDLSKTVSVTGTLQPNESRTVKAAVSEGKVATINVKVGDYVNAGDTIMTYDSQDLQDNLEDVEKQVNLDNYKTSHDIKTTNDRQEDQQWTHDRQLEKLTNDINILRYYYSALLNGDDDKSGKEFFDKHIEDYYKLNAFSTNISSYIDQGQEHTLFLPIERKVDMEGDYEYEAKYNDVVADFGAKLAQFEKDFIEFQNKNDDSLEETQYNHNVAAMQGDINYDKTEKQLKDAKDDLAETVVTAPISGVITSISVEEGDKVYSNSQSKTTLCVIQDTSAFKVTGSVNEYDIATLVKGQKAIVKTDSTGDEEFPATLTFVAPTTDATTSTASAAAASGVSGASGSSTSSSGYEVELSLDKYDDRLRVGMTAKTSIILDEVTGVLAVPYDCVQTDDDGNRYVNVVKSTGIVPDGEDFGGKKTGFGKKKSGKADGMGMMPGVPGAPGMPNAADAGADGESAENQNVEKVIVEIVFESDYYIAIKGDGIREGTVVEATSSSGSHDFFSMMMSGEMGGGDFGGPGPGGM